MKFLTRKLTMSQKVAQVINDQDVQFEQLNQESEDALDSFQKTVDQLSSINARIDESVTLMDQQMANITDIRNRMLQKKTRNDKVKTKIVDFLS